MQALSDRTASFTDSVIRRMTRISNQYGAVNLSQGFPDFDPPKPILDRLSQVAYEDYHQYSITWGAQDFREALAKKQSHFMGRGIDPNGEIVVTCGSTEAMMAAMLAGAPHRPAHAAVDHLRPRRARGRAPPAPQGARAVQPLEPLRQGLHARGA